MTIHVKTGEEILKNGKIDDFGKLLNSAWVTKKKLSNSISNGSIDSLYNHALKKGALGGKILGAGGGGFFLFYAREEIKNNIFKDYNKIINIPFKFSSRGTEIIYKSID